MAAEERGFETEWLKYRTKCPYAFFLKSKHIEIINFPLRDHVKESLDAAILENYSAFRMKEGDLIRKRRRAELMEQILINPELNEKLQNMQNNVPKIQIRKCHYFDWEGVKNPNVQRCKIYIEVEQFGPIPLPDTRMERRKCEYFYVQEIGTFIKENDERFHNYQITHSTDSLALLRMKSETEEDDQVFIYFSYEGVVPDDIIAAMHYKACTQFSDHLEPLIFFWQCVMSEGKGLYKHRFDTSWMSLEHTSYYVMFFLHTCRLLPQFMKESDVFLRSCITWEQVGKWDRDELQFFPDFFKTQKKVQAQESEYYNKTIGELFHSMISFYSDCFIIGNVELHYDKGFMVDLDWNRTYSPVRTLLCWHDFENPAFKKKVKLYHAMIGYMKQYLREADERFIDVKYSLNVVRSESIKQYNIQCLKRDISPDDTNDFDPASDHSDENYEDEEEEEEDVQLSQPQNQNGRKKKKQNKKKNKKNKKKRR